MVNKFIKYLIENKLVAILLLLIFVGWGIMNSPFDFNLKLIPKFPVEVDAIPDIGENQQIVFTQWEGQSPKDIEDQVTYPLTTSLLGIPGVKTIRSSSMFGVSSIYIIFEEDLDFYWTRTRILEKLNSLPNNLLPYGVKPSLGPDATGLGQIFWYTLETKNNEGGWGLQELRTVQDYYVKYALSSVKGVSEVSSIGGYILEYQIDINPDLMKQYGIKLGDIVKSVKESNRDIGAQTIEINKVEYLIRGLGYIRSISDIENSVVTSKDFTSIRIKDIANVSLGPKSRRGILDKNGVEAVGGVVVARYGSNPLEVINNINKKIDELNVGLPSKTLSNGKKSKISIVPFYSRADLIKETLNTLNEAITMEVLITVLVIIIMVFNFKASILISGLLPVAVLMVFIAMKLFNVDANIVALSGIAIAIGTMVDIGIILCENIIRHIKENKDNIPINKLVYNASSEVSGAIITAVSTTIISFIPIFTMIGAEGKLFKPLAFTKISALVSAIIVSLFLIPPLAAILFRKKNIKKRLSLIINIILIGVGVISYFYMWLGGILFILGINNILKLKNKITEKKHTKVNIIISILTIIILLTEHWRPLGLSKNLFLNFLFVSFVTIGLLYLFNLFIKRYTYILVWALNNKIKFLTIPFVITLLGVAILNNTEKEFMPSLDEGAFLYMPTSMPHSSIQKNKEILQYLDTKAKNIPEVERVLGKAGRVESALDPSPLSMFENIIIYKPEYLHNDKNKVQKYKVNKDGLFFLKDGGLIKNPNITKKEVGNLNNKVKFYDVKNKDLIKDKKGEIYRLWRPHIKSKNDIWDKIVEESKLLGVTSAPKLQPIETRLIMLQTGMRAPMGIKIKGSSLDEIESFGVQLEEVLKEAKGINKESVFADRIVGKPYLLIDIDREKLSRYGVSIEDIQDIIKVSIGGVELTKTVEGRERYSVRVRYPKEYRSTPEDIKYIYVDIEGGEQIPLGNLIDIRYEKGPQVIKSEDTFLVGYVLFDKEKNISEVEVINNCEDLINKKINKGELIVPKGISFNFTGDYENQLRAQKTLLLVVPLSLIIIFLILYFQFKSVVTSLMIFSSVFVAFSGGFIMIWLYNQGWFLNFSIFDMNIREIFNINTTNLSIAVWVGFIALFGIATDDGVLIATYIKQSLKSRKPKDIESIREAIIYAGNKRIRPCLMTTATTIIALLPVLTSKGKGSNIMIPMAIPSFGGMMLALITLFIVPVLYSWAEEYKLKK